MQKYITLYIILLFSFFAPSIQAQKVGLVLSGGGAKGCAHIGVIRALEEQGVPIDYIAGTSMGAIIGSLYAMGYSPDEMEELIKSDEFLSWQKGKIDENSTYYFKRNDPNPEFLNVKISITDSLTFKTHFLPKSLIAPTQMNFAFLKLFAQATAYSENNFDKLFVPFRCVASDVYLKEPVIHSKGDLGDAVRTSMTFPLVFKPITVNNRLLYDGGIYNNFPVNIIESDFNPDYIIGSSVASNPTKPNESSDLILQLENMIMEKTDYSIPKDKGLLLDFKFEDVGLLDFYKVSTLSKIGYDSTMSKIEEIKAAIPRTVKPETIELKRKNFRSKLPNLVFKNIHINGVNPAQEAYISKNFHNKNEYFDLKSFKQNYFKLLSDKKFSEIIPHAIYNKETEVFDLILDVKMDDNILFGIGGNISSSTSNQLYFGAEYQGIYHFAYDLLLNGQFGLFYNNVHLKSRIDLPITIPMYFKIIGNIHRFSYYKDQKPFYETTVPSEASSSEYFGKIKFGFPFLMTGKMELGTGYGKINDEYSGPYTPEEKKDETSYKLGIISAKFDRNSFTNKQFPIEGGNASLMIQYIFGNESENAYTPNENGEIKNIKKHTSWMQLSYKYDQYFRLSNYFILGTYAEGIYSSKPLCNNYTETMLQAPAFEPINHSKTTYNPAFRANSYLAGGVKPIYKINDQLHFRIESYLFLPIRPIYPNEKFEPVYGDIFSKVEYINELSAVVQLNVITISVYVNNYSFPKKNWNAGVNIGFLIFNNKLIEK